MIRFVLGNVSVQADLCSQSLSVWLFVTYNCDCHYRLDLSVDFDMLWWGNSNTIQVRIIGLLTI